MEGCRPWKPRIGMIPAITGDGLVAGGERRNIPDWFGAVRDIDAPTGVDDDRGALER
jgi:ribosomal protein S5